MIEKEHPIRAVVLCFDGSARLQFEQCLHVSSNSFRDVDLAGRAVRFHKRSRIYGITPDIEAEAAIADNARNDRAGMDADT